MDILSDAQLAKIQAHVERLASSPDWLIEDLNVLRGMLETEPTPTAATRQTDAEKRDDSAARMLAAMIAYLNINDLVTDQVWAEGTMPYNIKSMAQWAYVSVDALALARDFDTTPYVELQDPDPEPTSDGTTQG